MSTVSFSASGFATGGSGLAPTTFVYATGAPIATFDGSCQNVPADALGAYSFASPITQITAALSAAIGGQQGYDLGRIGYLAFPSAASFVNVGDRQSGRTALGAITTHVPARRLTSDGSAVLTGGANSLLMGTNQFTFGRGYLLAVSTGTGNATPYYALWPAISFLMPSASTSLTSLISVSGTTTTIYDTYSGGGSTWTLNLSLDTTNNCLNASVTGGLYTVHWLLVLDCLDIA